MLALDRDIMFENYKYLNISDDILRLSLEYEELASKINECSNIFTESASKNNSERLLKKMLNKLKSIIGAIKKHINNFFANAAINKIKSDTKDTVVKIRKKAFDAINKFITNIKSFLRHPIKFAKTHPKTSVATITLISLGSIILLKKGSKDEKSIDVKISKLEGMIKTLRDQIEKSNNAISECENNIAKYEAEVRKLNASKIKKTNDTEEKKNILQYTLYLIKSVVMDIHKCFKSLTSVIAYKEDNDG